jgi:hypothetical protein
MTSTERAGLVPFAKNVTMVLDFAASHSISQKPHTTLLPAARTHCSGSTRLPASPFAAGWQEQFHLREL